MTKRERLLPQTDNEKLKNCILLKPSGKKFSSSEIIIDKDGSDDLLKFRWFINSSGYVMRNDKKKSQLLHRLLLKAKKGQIVDHINGDILDNRKSNLRLVTSTINQHNAHKVRKSLYGAGVYKNKGRFHSHIRNKGKWLFLGAYDSPKEAEYAYWVKKNEFLPLSQQKVI